MCSQIFSREGLFIEWTIEKLKGRNKKKSMVMTYVVYELQSPIWQVYMITPIGWIMFLSKFKDEDIDLWKRS